MKLLALLLYFVIYATATAFTRDVLHQTSDDIANLHDLEVKSDIDASQIRSLGSSNDDEFKIPAQSDIRNELARKLLTSFENLMEKVVDTFQSVINSIDKITALVRKFKPMGNVFDGDTSRILKEIKEEAKQLLIKAMELNAAGDVAHAGVTFKNLKKTMDLTEEEMADNNVLRESFNSLLRGYLNNIKGMSTSTDKMKDLKLKLKSLRVEMSYKIRYLLENFEKQAQTLFKKAVALQTMA